MLQFVHCNLCGTDDARLLLIKDSYRVVRCRACGFVYVNPQPPEEEVKAAYTEDYFAKRRGGAGYLNNRDDIIATSKKNMTEIEKYKKKGRLIDVGCAMGFFLEVARERKWKVVGVDCSKFAMKYATKKLSLTVFPSLKDGNFPNSYFDVVTAWDYLEHLYDVSNELKEIYRVLKDDGILAITVPNMRNLTCMKSLELWEQLTPPLHLSYFTPSSLRRMLFKAGFEIVKMHGRGDTIVRKSAGKIRSSDLVDSLRAYKKWLSPLKKIFFDYPVLTAHVAIQHLNFADAISVLARKA